MRSLRVYAPFLAIVVVQALLVAFAPSTPDDVVGSGLAGTIPVGASGAGGSTTGSPAVSGATPSGDPLDPDAVSTVPGDPRAAATAGGTLAGSSQPAGDTSRCAPNGRQFALLYHAPPCTPAWAAGRDNGGATAQGVTATSVRVTLVLRKPNPTADPIMASQGLGITADEAKEQATAAAQFINANYELHGRKVELRVVESTCNLAPTDVPCYRELGRSAARGSFAVILVAYEPPEFFEEVARNGAIALGGLHYSEQSFASLAPYRYDMLPNGTLVSRFVAEYYCTKLSGKPASHAGAVIHPSVGRRDSAPRKLGIITADRPPLVAAARELQRFIARCSGETPPIIAGSPDAATAQQQVDAAMANMISSTVTTIVPLVDPVALSLITLAASRQTYFPEWLVTGENFIGVDAFARLQDPQQWRHAFGIDFEPTTVPPERMEATQVWRATGRRGLPGDAPYYAQLFWRYYQLAATMVQLAGPQLTAANVERALVGAGYRRGGWAESGGRADVALWQFGSTGHTALADVREVYWDPSRRSALDGRQGAYADLRGGRRYELGQLPAGLDGIPVDR